MPGEWALAHGAQPGAARRGNVGLASHRPTARRKRPEGLVPEALADQSPAIEADYWDMDMFVSAEGSRTH